MAKTRGVDNVLNDRVMLEELDVRYLQSVRDLGLLISCFLELDYTEHQLLVQIGIPGKFFLSPNCSAKHFRSVLQCVVRYLQVCWVSWAIMLPSHLGSALVPCSCSQRMKGMERKCKELQKHKDEVFMKEYDHNCSII